MKMFWNLIVVIVAQHCDTQTSTEARRPYRGGVRNWTDGLRSQGMARIASNHQKLGGREEEFFPRAFKGSMALLMS